MQSSPVTVRSGSNILFRGSWSVLARHPLTFLSVCSGIEAASVAWNPLGWRAVGFAEIEPFPSAVLAHHYPDVPNYGDFTKIDPARIGPVDILCGGTPRQAFSVAGARRSLDDDRGNLTLAFVDLAHALRPKNVVWENVPGVLSTKDNAFGCFLAGLVGASEPFVPCEPKPNRGKSSRRYGWNAKEQRHYVKWPRSGVVVGRKGRAAWTVKNAEYFSLAQRRERVLVVADFGNGADPAAVLFEPEGVRRNSPPSRKTREGVAPTISAHTKGGGGLGTDFDLDGGLIAFGGNRTSGPIDIAAAVNAHGGSGRMDFESETFICFSAVRRLTPRECERLQGFQFRVDPTYPQAWQDEAGRWWSPDYTAIPYRNGIAADGPRYKALGNSWAVPKFRWLGERIAKHMPR